MSFRRICDVCGEPVSSRNRVKILKIWSSLIYEGQELQDICPDCWKSFVESKQESLKKEGE